MATHELTILAIDDNPDNLTSLRAVIQDTLPQARVVTALSGPQGITLALAADLDVILLDIVMPGMDGYAVCRKLKEDPRTQPIPVVFLTALRTDRASRIRALEAGAVAFLSKPLDDVELIAQIRAVAKIGAANQMQRLEREQLAAQVAERTRELEQELAERKQAETALKQAETYLRTVLSNAPIVIFAIDNQGLFKLSEGTGLDRIGLKPGGIVGVSASDLYGTTSFVEYNGRVTTGMDVIQRVFAGETVNAIDELQGVYFDNHIGPIRDTEGKVVGIVGVATDITERKQAEEALRKSEQRYRSLFNGVPVGLYRTTPEGQVVDANPALVQMLGYPDCESLLAVNVAGGYANVEERGQWQSLMEEREGGVSGFETRWHQYDGTVVWVRESARAVRDADGRVLYYEGAVEDITERKCAEEALRLYTEQLRGLTARLANAEEGERRRLAQELHDRVGQNLTALSINLNIVRNLLPPKSAVRIGPRLEDSLELVGETMEHIRDVMAELRPPVLDDYGLLAALRWYGQSFAQRTGLATAIQGADPTPRLPLATEITLFRIAQEALTNAARHAQAHQVSVTLDAAAGGVRLTITDDGTGFDPDLRTQPNGRHAWGLLTMLERAESIDGRLVIDAAPGHGTRVIVEVGSGL